MKLISTSFLSSNKIADDLIKLNDTTTNYIHVDVMDGKFVKEKSLPYKELKNIYKYTSKRLDVHLMVTKPKKYIKDYANLNTEYLTIHLELEKDLFKYLELIKSYGIKAGLSINPDTDVRLLEPYLKNIDMVLMMSVFPGYGGQQFIESTYQKIELLKQLIKEINPKVIISVDGGVNSEISKKLDVDMVVSGSYIINSENFEERINSLR